MGEQVDTEWKAACPEGCGSIMRSVATRYNTHRYGLRLAVMQHLRNRHKLSGRDLSVKSDIAVKGLPRD